ncbi:MAG: DUF3990 domain-containing protein [Oscillospiraceae bacterium]|nr:DUF3990 domain-containing protein [Oscillospiraceae bacterium]
MIIYHGSTVSVEAPKILESERMLDFGSGFYTTSNLNQAMRWTMRVAERQKTNTRIVTEYQFDYDAAKAKVDIIEFTEPNEAWLDFVSANRLGQTVAQPYDIVIGPVANDQVYTTVLLYEQGILDKETAVKQLKVQELFDQILFHTERSLSYCHYLGHEIIGGG